MNFFRATRRVFLLLLLGINSIEFAYSETNTELRILIDVSGSMKQTDPKNQRAPALRLLVGLVPNNSRAGVWVFDQNTLPLIPWKKVSDAWKKQALAASKKIHSRGQHTHIEQALEVVIADWEQPSKDTERHVIILTDGMIDIGVSKQADHDSKVRLLSKLLPKFKLQNIKVHTVALSAQADHDLLKVVATETQGHYTQIQAADNLHRVFFRLFEQSTRTDKVPLRNNRFAIDSSITDMTVAVFKKPGARPTHLKTPDSSVWSYTQHPKHVDWHQETLYELITVRAPTPGEWALEADTDPDNRVMVLTNLKLRSSPVPSAVLSGERFQISAFLEQKGVKIDHRSFLQLVNFALRTGSSNTPDWPLTDSGAAPDLVANDGTYTSSVVTLEKPGEYNLTLVAKSRTFERLLTFPLHVYPEPMAYHTRIEKDKIHLSLIPHPGLFATDSLEVNATLADQFSATVVKNSYGIYTAVLSADYGDQIARVRLGGHRLAGTRFKDAFDIRLPVTTKSKRRTETIAQAQSQGTNVVKPLKQEPQVLSLPPEIKVAAESVPLPHIKTVEAKTPKAPPPTSAPKEEKRIISAVSWNWVLWGVVLGNGLLLLAGGYFYFKKPKAIALDLDDDEKT